jgi:hypothetical protein
MVFLYIDGFNVALLNGVYWRACVGLFSCCDLLPVRRLGHHPIVSAGHT